MTSCEFRTWNVLTNFDPKAAALEEESGNRLLFDRLSGFRFGEEKPHWRMRSVWCKTSGQGPPRRHEEHRFPPCKFLSGRPLSSRLGTFGVCSILLVELKRAGTSYTDKQHPSNWAVAIHNGRAHFCFQ